MLRSTFTKGCIDIADCRSISMSYGEPPSGPPKCLRVY